MQAKTTETLEENYYNIDYVIDVITKEAPNEKRLAMLFLVRSLTIQLILQLTHPLEKAKPTWYKKL